MTDFDSIYASGGWNGMGSGPGSTPEFTKGFRAMLEKLLETTDVYSVFEPGCGDWQWQRLVKWKSYLGVDIVGSVIAENSKQFPYLFARADIFAVEGWPQADMMLIKDLVHHVSPAQVGLLTAWSLAYKYVLWVVDMEGNKICNWPNHIPTSHLALFYEFDLTVENYPYGRKAAFLQINRTRP